MPAFLTDLLEISLGCGAVIALLLVLTPALSRRFSPRWRYWAWLILALRLAAPFNLSLPQAPVRLSVPAQTGASLPQTIPAAPPDSQVEQSFEPGPFWDTQEVVVSREGEVVTRQTWQTIHWDQLLLAVWLIGAAANAGAAWLGYILFLRRARRWSSPAAPAELEALEEQKALLCVEGAVALKRCAAVSSPLLMGFARPTILLPESLPEDMLRPTLAHELTHLKRRDLWYKLLLTTARCLHWFNPLVWLMVRRAQQDVELCCDYDLLKNQGEEARRAYGQAILDQMTAGNRAGSHLTTGFSGSKREVFRRFRAIMDASPKKKGYAALILTACAILLAGGIVAFGVDEDVQQPAEEEAAASPAAGQLGPAGQQLALVLRSDERNGQITYVPLDWFAHDDWQAFLQFLDSFDGQDPAGQAVEGTLSSSLQTYVWRSGSVSTLANTTLDAVVFKSASGCLCELTFDEEGLVKKVILRQTDALDLNWAGPDFTGFSGTVYDDGEAIYVPEERVLIINPFSTLESDDDSDRARYPFPVAEDLQLTDRQLALLDAGSTVSVCWEIQIEDGVVQSVEEQLELARAVGYYSGTDFIASLGTYEGAPCYQFDDPRWGVQLMVQPVAEGEHAGELAGRLLYRGKSTTFYFHTFPLAAEIYGHVAGESEFLLADLTGDGVPEFIYIEGYHGSGMGYNTCRVFDLAVMEEYSVLGGASVLEDFSALEASIQVDSEQWQDGEIVYQLTGPEGQTVTASCEWPEDRLEDMQPGIVIGGSYYIGLNEEKDGLVLTCSISSATAPIYLFLGDISAPLAFSPALKTFSISQPYTLSVNRF